jgi:ElaB/YqjD/DUF883 family membrane-anchored ribosome-binding protein
MANWQWYGSDRVFTPEGSGTSSEGVGTDSLPVDVAALRHDVDCLAAAVGALQQQNGRGTEGRAADAAGAVGQILADAAAKARPTFDAARTRIEARVEDNPLAATVLAFGTGMLLGLVTRRRGQ